MKDREHADVDGVAFVWPVEEDGAAGASVLHHNLVLRHDSENIQDDSVVCPNFGHPALTSKFTHFVDVIGLLRK